MPDDAPSQSPRVGVSAVPGQPSDVAPAVHDVRVAADRARAAYENEAAIARYSEALALLHAGTAAPDPATEYGLLAGRAECYDRVGDYDAVDADLAALSRLAQALGD